MATTETFNSMLKKYMPYALLVEQMKRRNYFWNKVKKDAGWMGGDLEIPFEGAEASSLSFGALTASNDVAEHQEVMGRISTLPELWGTMKFNEKDLERHGSLDKSFLKIFPGKISQFVDRMSERVSLAFLNGSHIATATANGDAALGIAVDHPERFALGEKVTVDDDNSAAVNGYVRSIDMETKIIVLYDARTGGAVVDLSGYTTAQNAKIYLPNANTAGFTSLKSILASSGNGGAATIYGQTKTAYPFLQAQQHDLSAVNTYDDVLPAFFDVFYDTINLGKSSAPELLCSMKNFKSCAKLAQVSKDYQAGTVEAGYGFRSVKILGNEGEMTITGLRDMQDTEAFVVDWDAVKVHGNNFFERKRHLTGDEFFLERATTGYSYLVDVKFFADVVVSKPSQCGYAVIGAY